MICYRGGSRWCVPTFVLLLVAVTACDGDRGRQPNEPANVVHRDSAGILIVETPGAIARAPSGWTVDAGPDLQIGSVTSDGPDQFVLLEGIRGNVAGLSDGRIVVVDIGAQEVRFFDAEGKFLGRTGGRGQGPGEFQGYPMLVPFHAGDSILIMDADARRLTVFSSDGQGHREFLPEGTPLHFLQGGIHGASAAGILAISSRSANGDGQLPRAVSVRWNEFASWDTVTVAQFDVPVFVDRTGSIPELRRVNVPFHSWPSTVMNDTRFLVTGGHSPEVREFDINGRLVRILRVVEPVRSVVPQDVDSVVAFVSAGTGASLSDVRSVYAAMDLPERWPTFQHISVDRLGWIWAELFRPPYQTTSLWMLFDEDGTARGTVELPNEIQVTDIGADYILGRWQDELGVEYVRRYRLHR